MIGFSGVGLNDESVAQLAETQHNLEHFFYSDSSISEAALGPYQSESPWGDRNEETTGTTRKPGEDYPRPRREGASDIAVP